MRAYSDAAPPPAASSASLSVSTNGLVSATAVAAGAARIGADHLQPLPARSSALHAEFHVPAGRAIGLSGGGSASPGASAAGTNWCAPPHLRAAGHAGRSLCTNRAIRMPSFSGTLVGQATGLRAGAGGLGIPRPSKGVARKCPGSVKGGHPGRPARTRSAGLLACSKPSRQRVMPWSHVDAGEVVSAPISARSGCGRRRGRSKLARSRSRVQLKPEPSSQAARRAAAGAAPRAQPAGAAVLLLAGDRAAWPSAFLASMSPGYVLVV